MIDSSRNQFSNKVITNGKIIPQKPILVIFVFSLLGTYFLSIYSYLLFHSLTEIFSISIFFTVFILVWLSRRTIDNNFFVFWGISLFFVSILDILHLLTYRGMGVFPEVGANLATQLWIAARYLQSFSFLAAFFFLNRRLRPGKVFIAYSVVLTFILASIFYLKNFPVCYSESSGLTPFKIISEYIISLLFLLSIVFLLSKRKFFNRSVLMFLIAAIFITILAEQSFTHYLSVYGFFNMLGHFLKVIAAYLLYRAVIVTGIENPQDLFYRKLKESEERFKAVAETASDAIVSAAIDGRIIFWNKGAEKMFGYDSQEMIGTFLTKIMSQDYQSKHLAGLERLRAGGQPRLMGKTYEVEGVRKNGQRFPLELSLARWSVGQDTFYTGILRDISERKENDRRLKKAKEELEERYKELAITGARDEAVLSSIADGLVTTDKDMRVIYLNKSGEIMSGWSAAEALGKVWPELIILKSEKEEKVSLAESPVGRAIREETTVNATYFYTKKDGTRFPVAITASPIILKGEVLGAVIVFRDVTRERDIDRAKSEFVSVASHQLKTPLTAIGWIAERLLANKAGKLAKKPKEYVNDIYQSNKRMIRLVNDLLSVSRLEEGKIKIEPKPLRLEEIITSLVKEQKDFIDKCRCQVVFEKPKEPLPLVVADESLLRQIVHNLLSNAIRYSVPKGKVRVGIKKDGNNFLLIVADNGIGIPKDKQYRVFEKFFRADNAQKKQTDGTGLGLYIIKMIVGTMGGKIWFVSEENKGTTFYVSLPLQAA